MNTGLSLNYTTLSQIPFSSSLNANKTFQSFSSFQPPSQKLLSFHLKFPSGSPVFASKTSTKDETSLLEMESLDFEDEFDEDFGEEEEEEDAEDEEVIVPLRNMRQWLQNKPRGFGEGKVYDTSIEDKLMEEMEQSRLAQLANLKNLKNNLDDKNPNSQKEKTQKQKVLEVAPNGIRVRLVNLPKKKNIHRDLQSAFKGVSGIINIIPAVSGNEKTREPVCKGFAYVDFKSEKEANRFVDMFSTKPITFGKIQKQIKCEIIKPSSPNPASANTSNNPSPPSKKINSNPTLETKDTSSDSFVEDAAFDKFKNGDDDIVSASEGYEDENLSSRAPVDDLRKEKDGSETSSQLSKEVVEKRKTKKENDDR